MSTIIEIDGPQSWRQRLQPATFRGAMFHVETGGVSAGRRVALHEFPKRNVPYSEDMGHRAYRWQIQAYIIVSPTELDYVPARDRLIAALDADGPGTLVHPTLPPMLVMCEMYSVEETRERGGYCRFEMVFVERGSPIVYDVTTASDFAVNAAGTDMSGAVQKMLNDGLGGLGLIPQSFGLMAGGN